MDNSMYNAVINSIKEKDIAGRMINMISLKIDVMKFSRGAKEFAAFVHKNQFRKDGVTPYFTHLDRVANLVAEVLVLSKMDCYLNTCTDIISGAYLHDTVEDQNVPLSLVNSLFGALTESYVRDLTNAPVPEKESARAAADRKNSDNLRIANSSPEVILIKLCDRLDNLKDLSGIGKSLQINFYKKTNDLMLKLAASENFKRCNEKYRIGPIIEEIAIQMKSIESLMV